MMRSGNPTLGAHTFEGLYSAARDDRMTLQGTVNKVTIMLDDKKATIQIKTYNPLLGSFLVKKLINYFTINIFKCLSLTDLYFFSAKILYKQRMKE